MHRSPKLVSAGKFEDIVQLKKATMIGVEVCGSVLAHE